MPPKVFHGERLRALREQRGFTQQDLATRLRLHTNQITRYENGQADPLPAQLKAIARELGVTADYLLGLTDDPLERITERSLSADERRFIDALRRGDLHSLLGMLQQTVPNKQEQSDVPRPDVAVDR
jgi:transcriptional regulator with XRE-family HTH domain